jgi:hypothetical protein
MDIIEPKRLSSLESFKIHIKEYTSDTESPGFNEIVLENQYGFTTIADLKRQIWVNRDGNKEWVPNRVWIAQEMENGLYNPIGMVWNDESLAKGVPSPFTNPGVPDLRLVDINGNQKPIYAHMNEGLLLESVFQNRKKDVTISLWTIETLIRKIGINLEKQGVLFGYINMYFPKIKTTQEAVNGSEDSEGYMSAKKYINQRNERLELINNFLGDEKLKKIEPFRLQNLRRWECVLPKYITTSKSLDILFYEFKISEDVPFLRYFPVKGHGEPLLKLATGLSGFPIISNKDMLASFLDEEPNTEMGPVLMAKIPFSSLATEVRATRNVALTIYWHSDGSANIILEAPRRDMLLEVSVLREANILLNKALTSLGYSEPFDFNLKGLSASFRIEIGTNKIDKNELIRRVQYFSPFLETVSTNEKSTSKLELKWKAVNNYEQENAVFNYFTKRILEDEVGDMTMETKAVIQEYIRGAMETFGRNEEEAKELFDDWFRRRTEVVPVGAEAVQAHNLGVDIEIEISHPVYFISFVGIDSEQTFNRVISVMIAYLYYNSTTIVDKVIEPPSKPIVNVIPASSKQTKEALPNASRWMNLLGLGDEEDEEEDEEERKPAEVEQEITYAPTDAKSQTLPPLKEWYKAQLDKFDEKLFGYSQTDETITVYSRTCQASSARQPNVMVAEQLDALVNEYGDAVEWVFLPPPDNIILDVSALSNKELVKEMLDRGFDDIIDEKGKTKKKKAELLEIFENALCNEPGLQGQFCRILRKKSAEDDKSKPIWFVARAGSNPDKPNYYICATYWCVRDNKPLIPSEFLSNKTRSMAKKDPESCPFCGGTLLDDLKNPKKGQTVIKRKGKPGKGEIHEIASYMDNIHPNKFALPCCFTKPTVSQIKPSEGTIPLPKDRRKNAEELPLKPDVNEDEDDKEKDDLENKDLTKILKTIGTKQYILGYEKRQLESGRIGLCPPQLDEMLGQDGTLSVIKAVGVAQHLNNKAKVFLRFGLGNRGASPGLSFLELVGFYLGNLQRAGKPPMKGAKLDIPTVYTAQGVLKLLLPEDPKDEDLKFLVNVRRAFERANYGNLIHEFAGNSNKLTQAQYEKFAKEQDFNTNKNPSLRPYIIRFANAWYNFVEYIKDESSPKELRHFENLFACPNVIFQEGLIPIIFEGSNDKDGNLVVNVKCPEYGISEFSKSYKPPFAFIWHDKTSNVYEPIIYVEASVQKDKKDKQKFIVLTSFHESDPKFTGIDSVVQNSISDFMKQFLSFEEGCGRYQNPPHPWMPDMKSNILPRLSQLMKLKIGADNEINSILRDRSNRLVGVLIKTGLSDSLVYIPCLEDGSLGLQTKSLYDIQSLPLPTLDVLLNLLTGKGPFSKIIGLKPVEVLYYEKDHKFCALRLNSGSIIPFAKFSNQEVIGHVEFSELMKKGAKPISILPWEEDIRFLSLGYDTIESGMTVVKDTIVEEGYNYLRISLSEWLATNEGNKTLKQLKALRESNLPLYELRRRGDILLEPLIHNWLDTNNHTEAIPSISLLRRNCIVEKTQDSCTTTPMCSWIGNECKIHTGTSEAIPDIKVYFTSRIIDEIMRYSNRANEILDNSVAKIGIPIGIVRTPDGILTSKSKIQDLSDDLDLDYVPTDDFSAGLTYPEDVHDDDLGRDIRSELVELPISWKKIGLSRLPPDITENRIKISLSKWVGEPFEDISVDILKMKKTLFDSQESINWSDKDWYAIAALYSADIIITRYNSISSKISKWIKASNENKHILIVFYVNETPEILLSSKNPLNSNDLPYIFQQYFDSSTPILLEQLTV